MNIVIKQELRDCIDPLTTNEFLALERSLLTEGCRDALVLWGEILIDGHNRYAICQKHSLPFQTKQVDRFQNIEDVMLWMIDNHLGRRSVTSFQRGVLALKKKEIVSARRKQNADSKTPVSESESIPDPVAVDTRDEIAKVAGISKPAITQIEKIRKAATPELVDAVRAGTISINAAATIASLPNEQQVAAVAGGKKELQQAARQVREMRTPRIPKETATNDADEAAMTKSDASLNSHTPGNAELDTLRAENQALKQKIAALTEELEIAKSRTA
jgi:hypothetical protein